MSFANFIPDCTEGQILSATVTKSRRARIVKVTGFAVAVLLTVLFLPVLFIGISESYLRDVPAPATVAPDIASWLEPASAETLHSTAISTSNTAITVSIVTSRFPMNRGDNLPLLAANVEKYFTSMTLSMASYERNSNSMKPRDRIRPLLDIHQMYLLLQGQIDAVKTWNFVTPGDPRGENWQATAEAWFDRKLLDQSRLWIEGELAALVAAVPEPEKDRMRKWIAIMFSTEGRDSDLSRDWVRANWDLGAHYWREVGGVEGRYRLAARELERRYSLFYDKTRGTKIREALPRRLDLD